MSAARPVQELEVSVHQLAVAGEAERESRTVAPHLVEVQRLVALGVQALEHVLARERRDEYLRFHARHGDVGRVRDVQRHDLLARLLRVRVAAGALEARAHAIDDAVDPDRILDTRQCDLDAHDIVQLQIGVRVDPDPELEREGILRTDDQSYRPLLVGSESL